VIGTDGFGFANEGGVYIKIPQTGRVVIGDDVDIGANTTIDRGALADTIIEDGVKLDNQIQIGHNCHIGAHTAMAGCVGVAGSAIIGKYCTFGGAAMVLGHLTIADRVHVGSGSMVSRSIAEPGQYTGFYPLAKNADWEKSAAIVRNLSSMREKIRALEKTIKTLTTQDEK
jgi:UDP-3-O-[3-hydroxymyristoyl] glucosamine N-acyltransferase